MARMLQVRYTTGGSTGLGRALAILVLVTGVVAGAPRRVEVQAPRAPTPAPVHGAVRLETSARGLEHPWALAFLPDGRLLVTERPGRVRLLGPGGHLSEPLAGVPRVQARGQGGLLDVALDPRLAENRFVSLASAAPGAGRTAGTAVARGRLAEGRREDLQVIYQQPPKVEGAHHFGARFVFARDGPLCVTQGERFDDRDQAQAWSSGLGKRIRITPDGSLPRDPPFVGGAGVRPEIWSYGHRNVQSAGRPLPTGQLWTVEHGARGGDELNRPEAGKNDGWSVISYGVHDSGAKLGAGTTKPGMEQPVYDWDPVIAPSGMTFDTGEEFPDGQGSLLIGALQPGLLVRLTLADGRVTGEARYLGEVGERLRDVRQAPHGRLSLLTDSRGGRRLRGLPAAPR